MTLSSHTAPASVYTDLHGLNSLRQLGRKDSDAGLKAVANQFEGMFLQMMLKSMRQASLGDPLFDSGQMSTYRDLFDQQLTLSLSGSGRVGLADVMYEQMRRAYGEHLPAETGDTGPKTLQEFAARRGIPAHRYGLDSTSRPAAAADHVPQTERVSTLAGDALIEKVNDAVTFTGPQDFIRQLLPLARDAASSLGLSPSVLLAQAALETGWGEHVIRDQAGNSSFNLFGIKANADWQGERITVSTLEYADKTPYWQTAPFRAYGSFADSFQDYVRFIAGQQRYQGALQQTDDAGAYLQALQDAGYATDPEYANKIQSILNSRDDLFQQVLAPTAEAGAVSSDLNRG